MSLAARLFDDLSESWNGGNAASSSASGGAPPSPPATDAQADERAPPSPSSTPTAKHAPSSSAPSTVRASPATTPATGLSEQAFGVQEPDALPQGQAEAQAEAQEETVSVSAATMLQVDTTAAQGDGYGYAAAVRMLEAPTHLFSPTKLERIFRQGASGAGSGKQGRGGPARIAPSPPRLGFGPPRTGPGARLRTVATRAVPPSATESGEEELSLTRMMNRSWSQPAPAARSSAAPSTRPRISSDPEDASSRGQVGACVRGRSSASGIAPDAPRLARGVHDPAFPGLGLPSTVQPGKASSVEAPRSGEPTDSPASRTAIDRSQSMARPPSVPTLGLGTSLSFPGSPSPVRPTPHAQAAPASLRGPAVSPTRSNPPLPITGEFSFSMPLPHEPDQAPIASTPPPGSPERPLLPMLPDLSPQRQPDRSPGQPFTGREEKRFRSQPAEETVSPVIADRSRGAGVRTSVPTPRGATKSARQPSGVGGAWPLGIAPPLPPSLFPSPSPRKRRLRKLNSRLALPAGSDARPGFGIGLFPSYTAPPARTSPEASVRPIAPLPSRSFVQDASVGQDSSRVGRILSSPRPDDTVVHGEASQPAVPAAVGPTPSAAAHAVADELGKSIATSAEQLARLCLDRRPLPWDGQTQWQNITLLDLSGQRLTDRDVAGRPDALGASPSSASLRHACPALTHLALNDNLLTAEGVRHLPRSLQSLQLEHNLISGTHALACFTALTELDLSRNRIERLDGLSCLVHLRKLTVTKNEVYDLAPALRLPLLDTLTADDNVVRVVDLAAAPDTRLRHLSLARNQLVGVHGLVHAVHLRTLNVEANDLMTLDLPGAVPRLRVLRASLNRRLRVLDVQSQSKLKNLYADGCALRGPHWVSNLSRATSLETLSLRHLAGGVVSWPPNLPPSLRRIFLASNAWVDPCSAGTDDQVNDEPAELPELVYIDLAECHLAHLPHWLARVCPALRHADLACNAFRTSADLAPLADCLRLKRLDLRHCALERTSDLVRALDGTPVEMLDTRGNPLTAGLYAPLALSPLRLPAPQPHASALGSACADAQADSPRTEADQATVATAADAAWRRARPWAPGWVHARALHRGSLAMACPRLRVLDAIWVADEDVVMAQRLLGHDEY